MSLPTKFRRMDMAAAITRGEVELQCGYSRNHRMGVVYTDGSTGKRMWTDIIRTRKGVRANRLPRGSKRTTGIWNGQNVVDMLWLRR